MRSKVVAGNWKMHGNMQQAVLRAEAVARWVQERSAAPDLHVVLFPPAVHIDAVSRSIANARGVAVGCQDVHWLAEGACTGDVSAEMAADAGARWAIVGHSERRTGWREDDALVARKAVAALRARLRPVVCVGEREDERESGNAELVVTRQVRAIVDAVGADALSSLVIAYEPVWAIGTGRTATPALAQEMHGLIRAHLGQFSDAAGMVPILYGGSVKGSNAAELFAQPDIDGGLIGGASLQAEEFLAICDAAVTAWIG